MESELIARLQKIAALTTSSNAGEAAAATAKLSELLLKYNLSLRDIATEPTSTPADAYENYQFELDQSGIKRTLIHVLAKHNFAKFIYRPGTNVAWLVGEPHNVDAVLWMASVILPQLDRLADEGWQVERDNYSFYIRKPSAREWKRDFRMGAIHTIDRRLQQDRQQAEQVSTTTTALVRVMDQELATAYRTFHPHTRAGRGTSYGSSSGYGAGVAAGSRVGWNKPIGAGR